MNRDRLKYTGMSYHISVHYCIELVAGVHLHNVYNHSHFHTHSVSPSLAPSLSLYLYIMTCVADYLTKEIICFKLP